MISLEDIKKSLIKLLHGRFSSSGIRIFGEDLDQLRGGERPGVTEKVFPCLHVQLTPLMSELVMGANSRSKTVLVDITYLEETKTTNTAMYDMAEQLEDLFGSGFWVKDIHLCIENLNATTADDLLHVTFQVEYIRPLPKTEEDAPLFETISVATSREE